jgi:biopolymer transport protein ExbB
MKASFRWFLPFLFSLAMICAPCAHAQETADAPPATKAEHKTKTLLGVLKDGGVIMIPIGLVSVAMCSLIVLGFITLQRKRLVPDVHVAALRKYFTEGDYQSAVNYCREHPGFFTDTVYTGLVCAGQGKEVSERAMEDTLAKGVASLSTRNYYLNLIGVVTPMLGLTGTVLGMMGAFSTLGTSGIGDPSALAGAIGEVLVATASGLFIAIPAFTFYYVFRNWITGATAYCEDHVNTLFRAMPYHDLERVHFGTEPIFAARPNWIAQQPEADGIAGAEPSLS